MEELLRVLNAHSTKAIKFQLVDLLAATQTLESHEAFKKAFDFTNMEHFDYIESYLQALAIGTRPKEKVLEDLYLILKSGEVQDEKVRDSLVQSISSISQRFARLPGNSFKSKIVEQVTNLLIKSFKECTTTECKVIYLRGIKNLAAPATMELLLDYATAKPHPLSVNALKALKSFPVEYWKKPTIKKKFQNIFYQRYQKYDSSARTLALDILLDLNPQPDDIREMLLFLQSNDKAFEVKQYLIQKLKMISEKCSRMRNLLEMALKNEPQLMNWNSYGGQKGLSTLLHREYSSLPSFNGTILSVQEMNGGVLKRGTVDLMVEHGDEQFSIFTVSYMNFKKRIVIQYSQF